MGDPGYFWDVGLWSRSDSEEMELTRTQNVGKIMTQNA